MSIPLSILLYIYIAFIVLFLIFSFFHIYHLLRFVAPDFKIYAIILGYLIGSLIIMSVTAIQLVNIDWSQAIDIMALPSY